MKKIEKPKVENLEKAIETFISNAERKEKKKEWTRILLRIKCDFIEHIDEKIKEKIGATRTSWILEAIQEKIKRETKGR